MTRKRHAFVGTGGRALSFIRPLVTTYGDHHALVGLCCLSPARMAYYNALPGREMNHAAVPMYTASRFDDMLREQRPDDVFVCTMDATHDRYIVRALEAGCDVITEKPMTTDAAKCRAILAAVKASGKRLRVAFSYRWALLRTRVKELIVTGTIGRAGTGHRVDRDRHRRGPVDPGRPAGGHQRTGAARSGCIAVVGTGLTRRRRR